MDVDRFDNTAAWLEHCDGMSRFAAEAEAARRQGFKRHEVMDAISKRNLESARDHHPTAARHAADNMPRLQSHAAEETRPLLGCDVRQRGGEGVLPSLRMEHGGVV